MSQNRGWGNFTEAPNKMLSRYAKVLITCYKVECAKVSELWPQTLNPKLGCFFGFGHSDLGALDAIGLALCAW